MNTDNKRELESSIFNIPLEKIVPNPFQPRISFDDSKLSALADSIVRYGVLQPIVVTVKEDDKKEKYYELIAGERRYRASKLAGLKTIPAIIKNKAPSDEEKFELAIIENLQREDLNPVDKARAFLKLSKDFKLTHGDIATRMGKSREYVSNSLRLLSLPDDILNNLAEGIVSEAHARPLLMLKDRIFEQKELLKKIIKDKLTVRETERIARKVLAGETISGYKKPSKRNLKSIEDKLAEKFGTKVHINASENGSGKVTIDFFSDEDLNKIISLVGAETENAPYKISKEDIRGEFTGVSILSKEINSLSEQEDLSNNINSENHIDIENNNLENKSTELDGFDINFGKPYQEKETKQLEFENNINNFNNDEIHNFSNTKEDNIQELSEIHNFNIENSGDIQDNNVNFLKKELEVEENFRENIFNKEEKESYINQQLKGEMQNNNQLESDTKYFTQPETVSLDDNNSAQNINTEENLNFSIKKPELEETKNIGIDIQNEDKISKINNIDESKNNLDVQKNLNNNNQLESDTKPFMQPAPISFVGDDIKYDNDPREDLTLSQEELNSENIKNININNDLNQETNQIIGKQNEITQVKPFVIDEPVREVKEVPAFDIKKENNFKDEDINLGGDAAGDSIYEEFLKSKQKAQKFKEEIVDRPKKQEFSETTGDFMDQFSSSYQTRKSNEIEDPAIKLERLRREALGLDTEPEDLNESNIEVDNIAMGSDFFSKKGDYQNNQSNNSGLNNFSL